MIRRVNKEKKKTLLQLKGHKSEHKLRGEIVAFKSESIKEEKKSDDPLLKNPYY